MALTLSRSRGLKEIIFTAVEDEAVSEVSGVVMYTSLISYLVKSCTINCSFQKIVLYQL